MKVHAGRSAVRGSDRATIMSLRARNVARALHVLSGKKGRFMGRSW
jgi:hypothetical protein